MKNVTVAVSDELAKRMEKHEEVNWSEICKKGIEEYLYTRSDNGLENARGILNKKKKESFRKGYELVVRNVDELSMRALEVLAHMNPRSSDEIILQELGALTTMELRMLDVGSPEFGEDGNLELERSVVTADREYIEGMKEVSCKLLFPKT